MIFKSVFAILGIFIENHEHTAKHVRPIFSSFHF